MINSGHCLALIWVAAAAAAALIRLRRLWKSEYGKRIWKSRVKVFSQQKRLRRCLKNDIKTAFAIIWLGWPVKIDILYICRNVTFFKLYFWNRTMYQYLLFLMLSALFLFNIAFFLFLKNFTMIPFTFFFFFYSSINRIHLTSRKCLFIKANHPR